MDNTKGFKAFTPGLVCKGKKYAENTDFEEAGGDICGKGMMHYCVSPFDCLDYYPLIGANGEPSDFAAVEALEPPVTDDGRKFATKKLHIGLRLGLPGFVKACVDFMKVQTIDNMPKSDLDIGSSGYAAKIGSSGDVAQIGSSGDVAQIGSSGNAAKIGSSGDVAQIGSSGDVAQIGSSGYAAQIGSSGYVTIGHTSKIQISNKLYPNGLTIRLSGADQVTGGSTSSPYSDSAMCWYTAAGVFSSGVYIYNTDNFSLNSKMAVDSDAKGFTLSWEAGKVPEVQYGIAFAVKGTGANITCTLEAG